MTKNSIGKKNVKLELFIENREIEGVGIRRRSSCSRARGPCRRGSRSPWGWCGPCKWCTTSESWSCRIWCRSEQPPASWGHRWCRRRCTSPSPSFPTDRSIPPRSSSHSHQTLTLIFDHTKSIGKFAISGGQIWPLLLKYPIKASRSFHVHGCKSILIK